MLCHVEKNLDTNIESRNTMTTAKYSTRKPCNEMSDRHVLKHHKSFWKLTLRRFLSHIFHEGLNLEVVICEVEFREIRSEHRKKNWF